MAATKSRLITIPETIKVTDALFLPTLNDRLLSLADPNSGASVSNTAGLTVGTHAQRPSSPPAAAAEYYEVDRSSRYYGAQATGGALRWIVEQYGDSGLANAMPGDLKKQDVGFLYTATDTGQTWVWSGTGWVYQSGMQRLTAAALYALKPSMGPGYDGALYYTTDYGHVSRYNKSATPPGLEWAPGTLADRSGVFHLCAADPRADFNVPTNAWHLCDGTSQTCQNPEGSTFTVATPAFTSGGTAIQATIAAYSGTIAPAAPVAASGAAAIPPSVSIPLYLRR